MSKVLVTGATGFIGHYVINELLQRGHEVIATSSNEEKAATYSWFPMVTYRALDLQLLDDSVDYFQYFEQPDSLIHLAWEGLPNYKKEFHLTENLPRHLAFLENLLRNGLQKLNVTGTCFEYGMQEGALSEEMEVHPDNAYAIAKDKLRRALEVAVPKYKADFNWIRLFYIYGQGQNPNSLFSQFNKAVDLGDTVFNMSQGDQLRDFLPIKEIASIIVTIALQNKVPGIINAGSGRPISVIELVENWKKERGSAIELNRGYYSYSDIEPMQFWADTSKLKNILQDNERPN